MAKSGQYIPHKSQPLHLSGCTTCGGWYPLELKAEDSASTLVGQNSTQKPQALQRSTTMETRPFATSPPGWGRRIIPQLNCHYRLPRSQAGVTWVTKCSELGHREESTTGTGKSGRLGEFLPLTLAKSGSGLPAIMPPPLPSRP